jgi:N-acetylglucosaminyldiphosphoundecaprenol N-acetyl-beta-D-mannosaminyltransferase
MRAALLGCPIDILTMAETVEIARNAMRTRERRQHVALNVAKLVNMRTDACLARDVMSSDVVGIDGMGIVIAARCLGVPVHERVAGIDLFNELLATCANEGFRPFLLGATPEVLLAARDRILARHPTLQFAGLRDGYFTPDQEREIVEEICASGADCLFVGMPTPRKERFIADHRDRLNVPFIMGVGGSFDVLAGHVQRAPLPMQRWGLEWLYRVYQEPQRMWWRYARTNALFAALMAKTILARLTARLGFHTPHDGRISG